MERASCLESRCRDSISRVSLWAGSRVRSSCCKPGAETETQKYHQTAYGWPIPPTNRVSSRYTCDRSPRSPNNGSRFRRTEAAEQPGHAARELFYQTSAGILMSVPISTGGNFTAGSPSKVFDATPYVSSVLGRMYDVSPEGQRFPMLKLGATSKQTAASPSLVVVLN